MNDPGCVCVWLTGVGEPSGWEEDGRTTGRGEGDKRTTRRSKKRRTERTPGVRRQQGRRRRRTAIDR